MVHKGVQKTRYKLFIVEGGTHWIVASSVGLCNEVGVYDSLYNNLDHETECLLAEMFPGFALKMLPCQKQSGGTDCGLFTIANATAIAFQNWIMNSISTT